jgi:hypothetical protein
MKELKFDGYGCGYGYSLCGYLMNMVADMYCHYPADTECSSFLRIIQPFKLGQSDLVSQKIIPTISISSK